MEEVTRTIARIALIAVSISSFISISSAEVCMSPRIKRAKACGVVIDPYGMRIPNARVAFGAADLSLTAITDIHGKFSVATKGDEVRVQVEAPGFKSAESSVGRLKEPGGSCKKPLYVMLTIGEQGCAMISTRKSDLLLAKKD